VGRLSRSVTRVNATRGFAPAMTADSSSAGSIERKAADIIRYTRGDQWSPSTQIIPPRE